MADAGTGVFHTSDIQTTLGVGRGKTPWWRRWWAIATYVVVALIAAWIFLTPLKKVTVGAEVSGRIDAVLVDFNDRVKKGQVIARINTDALRALALQAQAAVAQAQANLA